MRRILLALCPGARHGPPSAQSPFAHLGRYLRCRAVLPHVSRRYPAFIAPTSSCASPKPSTCLGLSSCRRSLPVAASPGWESDLPDVISADLSQHVWSRTPAASRMHIPVSSPEALAVPKWVLGRRFATIPTAISVGLTFSALQTFTHVQTCCFARHSNRSYPRLFEAGQP